MGVKCPGPLTEIMTHSLLFKIKPKFFAMEFRLDEDMVFMQLYDDNCL